MMMRDFKPKCDIFVIMSDFNRRFDPDVHNSYANIVERFTGSVENTENRLPLSRFHGKNQLYVDLSFFQKTNEGRHT